MISQKVKLQLLLQMQILGVHAVTQLLRKFLIFPEYLTKSIHTDPEIRKSQRNGIRMPSIPGPVFIILHPSETIITELLIILLLPGFPIGCCQRNQEFQILQIKIPQMALIRIRPVMTARRAALMKQSYCSVQYLFH